MNNSRKRKSEDDLRGGDGSAGPPGPRVGGAEAGPTTTAGDAGPPGPDRDRGGEERVPPGCRACGECGCHVPESNWLMHEAVCGRVRGGGGRAGSTPTTTSSGGEAEAGAGAVSSPVPSGSAGGASDGPAPASPLMGDASGSDVMIEGVDDGIEARRAADPREELHDTTTPPSTASLAASRPRGGAFRPAP